MQEFTTVSASFYDPAALANKLTEKSADGWTVVSIVSTGGDVTAFLSRASDGSATPMASAGAAQAEPQVTSPEPPPYVPEPAMATSFAAEPMPAFTPEPAPAPTPAEPAGWAVAPEPAAPAPAPGAEPAPAYTPAPAPAAVAPTPAVPAGWYADPAGRFELRYWDGTTWTEHVSRAGQQYTDPPVA